MSTNSNEDDLTVNRTEARAGSTPGVVRYVLGGSLLLIVILFGALLLIWR